MRAHGGDATRRLAVLAGDPGKSLLQRRDGLAPMITSGLVDPGRVAWGARTARIAGTRWTTPGIDPRVVPEGRLARWVAAQRPPKVLVASQTPVIAVPPLAGMPAASSTLAAAGPATEASRTLSMIYTADGFQRAVIDGQYVAPGQRLADGARVDSITADHVVLRDRQGRQVLRLGHPRQALNGRTPGPAGTGLAQR